MDYVGIIKRSWQITWKYKILWLFGLLAGGMGGGGNYSSGSSNTSGGSGDLTELQERVSSGADAFGQWFADNLAIVVALAIIAFIAGLALWVLSIAAQGGLVRLSSEADQERPVLGSDGWGTGFRYWGRTFLIQMVLSLPMVILVGALTAAAIVSFVPAMAAGEDDAAAILGSLGIMCGVFAIAIPVLVIIGFILSSLQFLALRYGILEDRPAFSAIGAAWGAFKSRWKQVFGIWVALFVVGMVYSIATGVVAVGFGIPAGITFLTGNYALFAGLILVLALVMLLPNSVYSALHSTVWTVFFRRLTGHAEAAPAFAPASAVAGTPAYLPPPPPAAEAGYTAVAPAPPAPPAPPAQEQPPAPESPAEDV